MATLTGLLKVTPAQLNSYAGTFDNSAIEVQNLTNHMLDTAFDLCVRWEGGASEMYYGKFRTLEDDMRKMFRMMREHSEDLKQMAKNYENAENTNISTFEGLGTSTDMLAAVGADGGSSSASANVDQSILEELLQDVSFVDWLVNSYYLGITFSLLNSLENWLSENNVDILASLKSILKVADSWGDIEAAGIGKDIVSYIEDLVGFYTGDKKGLTGASDLCDLYDSSVGSWKGIYDFFSDKYDQTTGFWGDVAQKNVEYLGLSAGFIELLGSLFSASDGLESKSWSTAVADYVDCGGDIVTILKSAYKLDHIGDASSLAKSKAGLWSALSIYAALGEAGVEVVSQGFRSYEEYYADGVWDLEDTAATGIDIAITGLHAISHSLTLGLDDWILGLIDRASGGDGNPDNFVKKSADGWKLIGTTIGDWLNGLFN